MRFGAAAIRAVASRKFGHMVAIDPPDMTTVPLEMVTGTPNQVPLDWDVVHTAREMGICLGD
jgi:6-phosphofructokinase 1